MPLLPEEAAGLFQSGEQNLLYSVDAISETKRFKWSVSSLLTL